MLRSPCCVGRVLPLDTDTSRRGLSPWRGSQGGRWHGVGQGCLSVPRAPGSAGIVVTQKHKLRPKDISTNCDAGSVGDWGFQNVLECSRMFNAPGGTTDHLGFSPLFASAVCGDAGAWIVRVPVPVTGCCLGGPPGHMATLCRSGSGAPTPRRG